MAKLTKNRKKAIAMVDASKTYDLAEAAELLKKMTFVKFDESVDVNVRLGVDPRKADQMVRGSVQLPHGVGKTVRVLVLCTPDKEEEAKAAGADLVGLDDYIEKIKQGWTDIDVIICTPNVMGKVGKVTWAQVEEIAKDKMEDLNAFTIHKAMSMVAGTARSMGLTVEGTAPWENN